MYFLISPHLTSPHLTSPHLTSPHLTSPLISLPLSSRLQEIGRAGRDGRKSFCHLLLDAGNYLKLRSLVHA